MQPIWVCVCSTSWQTGAFSSPLSCMTFTRARAGEDMITGSPRKISFSCCKASAAVGLSAGKEAQHLSIRLLKGVCFVNGGLRSSTIILSKRMSTAVKLAFFCLEEYFCTWKKDGSQIPSHKVIPQSCIYPGAVHMVGHANTGPYLQFGVKNVLNTDNNAFCLDT